MSPRRAIVIGSGLGGLATSIRLARMGWRVIVFEQALSPGGKMNRFQEGGYTFDTGPSLITMPWVFQELFTAAGQKLEEHLELVPVEPAAEYHFADGVQFRVSNNLPEWLSTLRSHEAGADARFLQFMSLGARLFDLSRRTFFAAPPGEPPAAGALGALCRLPIRHAWGPYHKTVESFFRSPHLRQMYLRYATYVGSSPWKIPAMLSVIPYLEHAYGGWHVRGGLYRIIEALLSVASALGVEVRTASRVARILRDGGRASGVQLPDGSIFRSDIVIMNGDASMAGVMLGQPGAVPLSVAERSMSGFLLLLGLRRKLSAQSQHTVYFSADYPKEFRQIFDDQTFPDEPTVYVSIPSRDDSGVAPAGCEALFVMANAPASDTLAWGDAEIIAARSSVLRRLERGGLAITEADIAVSRIWTPRTIASAYDMPGGAIYGTHSHGCRHAFLRPPNRDRKVAGLYCVGGSTHPGGGTPTVLISARIVSELIGRHEKG